MLRYTYTSILTRPFLSFFFLPLFLTFKCLFVYPGAALNQKKKAKKSKPSLRRSRLQTETTMPSYQLVEQRGVSVLFLFFFFFSFSFFRFHSSCTSYETEKSIFVISSWPKLIWRRIKMTWWSVSLTTMKGKNSKGKGAAGYRYLRASCESKGFSSKKKHISITFSPPLQP